MEIASSDKGWDEMGKGWPARFAEYNSHKTDGSMTLLDSRKTSFSQTHTNNPVLTAAEAKNYTIKKVLGGSDNWDPTVQTKQIEAPLNVKLEGTKLSWDAAKGAIGYVVYSGDEAVAFTCQTSCNVPNASGTYTVRAANEMGGLGCPSATASQKK